MSRNRKWLPAEVYSYLALVALAAEDGPLSKRRLAWETRANHYVITKALVSLERRGLVSINDAETAFEISITEKGAQETVDRHDYVRETFGHVLQAHFQYGPVPAWARRLVDSD